MFRSLGSEDSRRNDGVQRDVDHRIGGTQQAVGHISPNQLAALAQIWYNKGQHGEYREGNCADGEVGPSLPPFGVGLVYDYAHDGVGDGVDQLGHQHHGSSRRRGDSENIGVEDQQIRGHGAEYQITAQIADAVADSFAPFTFHIVFLSSHYNKTHSVLI